MLAGVGDVPGDAAGYTRAGTRGLTAMGMALAVPAGVAILAAVGGSLAQHRLVFSAQGIAPQFSRVSPMSGLKRLYGVEAWVQFAKGLLKVALVGAVAGSVLWGERDRLESFAQLDPTLMLAGTLALCLKLLMGMLALYLVVAAADAGWARMRWRKRLMMSKQEVKEEAKESEGSPEIKGRIRQIRMQRLKKRMMAAVPQSTVVLANPTHYAVALRYETGMRAPVCVAKGVDALALRIRAVAAQNDVPVIENPPLARALHATVKIDAEIPPDHYRAVAEVIGYVMRLRRRAA
jgi:flagellar biosynthesis protein FlhB